MASAEQTRYPGPVTHAAAPLVPAAPPPQVEPPHVDRPLAGLMFMAGGFFCYSVSDMAAKLLTGALPPTEVAWIRMLGLLVVGLALLARRGPGILRTVRPVLQTLRGAAGALSSVLFISAIHYVPLADAVAVSFVAPFLVTLLAALILGEPVGLRRWLAVAVGLVGTVIVIRPGMGLFHPAIFLVLAAASFFALRQIVSRRIATTDATVTTIVWSGITGVAVLTIPALYSWTWPSGGTTLFYLLILAGGAGIGEVLVIRALELAQAVTLAPLHYTLIVWSTFFGWLVFSQLPDRWTIVGAAVVMSSGLYTLHRERLALKRQRAAQPDAG